MGTCFIQQKNNKIKKGIGYGEESRNSQILWVMFQPVICCMSFGKPLTFSVCRCKMKIFPEIVTLKKKKKKI